MPFGKFGINVIKTNAFQKLTIMDRKLLILILLPLLASGCLVSKKKYNAMTSQKELLAKRLSAEQAENKLLKEDLKSAIADFETMKYELHKSDALKSDKVGLLLAGSETLKDQVKELEQDLKEARRQFQYQKNNSQESESQLELLNQKIKNLSSDTANLQFTLNMTKEREQAMHQELKTTKEQYRDAAMSAAKLKTEMEQQKQKMVLLEQQLVSKAQTLQNVSESFIELRKALLSAKTSGKSIDPNNNKLVDKIARLLGHY